MTKMNFFITGINRGFGFELALHYLQKGHSVFGFSRTWHYEDNILNDYINKKKLVIYNGDLNSIHDIKNSVELAIATFGKIDVLINNAAIKIFKSGDLIKYEDFYISIHTNLLSQIELTMQIIEIMKKQGYGHIINVSSRAGIEFYEEASAYSVAKAGLIAFTLSFAPYLEKYGIKINCLSPPTFTNMSYRLEKPTIDHSKLLSSEKVIQLLDKILFSKKFVTGKNFKFYSYKSWLKNFLITNIQFFKSLPEIFYR